MVVLFWFAIIGFIISCFAINPALGFLVLAGVVFLVICANASRQKQNIDPEARDAAILQRMRERGKKMEPKIVTTEPAVDYWKELHKVQ